MEQDNFVDLEGTEMFRVILKTDEEGNHFMVVEFDEDWKPFVKNEEVVSKKVGDCVMDILQNDMNRGD